MNKPIKAKNLPLFSIIDLDQLRREKHLEGTEVTDFFTARDGKVYLLMEQPSETSSSLEKLAGEVSAFVSNAVVTMGQGTIASFIGQTLLSTTANSMDHS